MSGQRDRGRRRSAAWLCAALAAAGCAASPGTPPAETAPPQTVPVGAAATTAVAAGGVLGMGDGSDAVPASGDAAASGTSETDDPVAAAPSRSGDAVGPFGTADMLLGAGAPPTGLQAALGPGDWPGPLWQVLRAPSGRFGDMQVWSRIFDGCWELDEHGNVTGGDYHSRIYVFGPDDRGLKYHPSCSNDSNAEKRFSAYFGGPWGHDSEVFATRRMAEMWLDARRSEAERVVSESEGLLSNARGFGLANSLGGVDQFSGIRFAPWDAPVDEVRVVRESATVRDGVLRGFVQNMSRRLWAYDVAVSADGRDFVWPLSLQPGEVAPFEMPRWDGPTDTSLIQFAMDADMSWHADASRAFGDGSRPDMLYVAPSTQRVLADRLRGRYPEVTADAEPYSVSVGVFSWDGVRPVAPDSHPSLADDIARLTVEDLRAYGAVVDSHGRVIDVGPASVLAVGTWLPSELWPVTDAESYVEVQYLPHEDYDVARSSVSVAFDVHGPSMDTDGNVYADSDDGTGPYSTCVRHIDREMLCTGIFHGGVVLWIGAAYPERPPH
ncbi:hypothetical protein [Candidatus Poriferisodalis sp.]|uniref:hypothetical protein n=1 Tax=Candidatus Poriferisodalis sp. TaxID=3101277 RepID=UPI003AF6C015